MHTALEKTLLETIHRFRMMAPGDRVGVAVSGGADSVALLRLLESLRGELGVSLVVVHFDHSLRGAESKADANFIASLARASGLESVFTCEDVAAAARENGWNIEDAARRLRYAFFQRVVHEGHATRIAVAHTADDQAETLLAHILRGTGLTGLAGIYPVIGPVVRPLLESRRQDLRAYLRAMNQTWREDSTNTDLHRQRARIREQLLPLLERDFSPAIVNHLVELARLAREEESFWKALVEDRFFSLAEKRPGKITIQIYDLLSPLGGLPKLKEAGSASTLSLTERMIRRLYEELRGDCRKLAAAHVEAVIRLALEGTSGRRLELPAGISVERVFNNLVFSSPRSRESSKSDLETVRRSFAYQYSVSIPEHGAASISVPELGTCFRLKVIDWPSAASETKRDSNVLDADLIRNPLILRNWRPGDAYRPRGRRQARKLKQMFLTGRVPNSDRACWPVLECRGQVIWARGMPAADDFCAHDGTRTGVLIEEDRLGADG